MKCGVWTNKFFRDVHFIVTKSEKVSAGIKLRGYWYRLDFGWGGILLGDPLNPDTLVVSAARRKDWKYIG